MVFVLFQLIYNDHFLHSSRFHALFACLLHVLLPCCYGYPRLTTMHLQQVTFYIHQPGKQANKQVIVIASSPSLLLSSDSRLGENMESSACVFAFPPFPSKRHQPPDSGTQEHQEPAAAAL